MAFNRATAYIEPIRVSHRGLSAYQNRLGTTLTIKLDNKIIYSQRTNGQMTTAGIKRVIDSIKDFDRRMC